MKRILLTSVLLSFMVIISQASASLTVAVSQFGADSGSVMKGESFTVTVSGLTGSGSVTLTTLQNSSVFSSSENSTKTYSDGTTSVSWTTVTANEKLSAQTLSAQSAAPNAATGTSSSFDIKLPPSIVTSVTPSSFSDPSGSEIIQMTVQNWGETTAQSVAVGLTLPSGATLTSGSATQTISSIAGGEGGSGESVGVSWTVSFSGVSASSITITTTPSNADSVTDTISITVTSSGAPVGNTPGSGSPGGGGATLTSTEKKDSRKPVLVPGVGLRNNLKLQAALEKVMNKGKMSQEAFQNMLRLSASITSNISTTRNIRVYNGTSTLTNTYKYNGLQKATGFSVYETVPKAFANNAANITVTALGVSGYETVETDPEYIFTYSSISPNQEVSISYSVRKEVNTSLIDQFQTEIYAEGLETAAAPGTETPSGPSFVQICNPGERRCSGMNVQQCSVLGDNWVTLQTCQTGCQESRCVGEAPSIGVMLSDWGWLIIIIISIVIAGAVALVLKKRKKEKPFKM